MYSAGVLDDAAQVCRDGSESWAPISSLIASAEQQQSSRSSSQRKQAYRKPKRNSLFLPIIGVSVLLVIATGFFFIQQGDYHAFKGKSLAVVTAVASARPAPIIPAPPKPRISDDTRSRVLNFVEKGSKLSTMTQQGVAFTPFSDQLTDVKSSWETLAVIGLPETWNRERTVLESAIEGWTLAKEIWERKVKAASNQDEDLELAVGAAKIYGNRLKQYSETAARCTGDDSPRRTLEQTGLVDLNIISIDNAIRWSLSTASLSFLKAREGIKLKINE